MVPSKGAESVGDDPNRESLHRVKTGPWRGPLPNADGLVRRPQAISMPGSTVSHESVQGGNDGRCGAREGEELVDRKRGAS
jgi:hypothetical protein